MTVVLPPRPNERTNANQSSARVGPRTYSFERLHFATGETPPTAPHTTCMLTTQLYVDFPPTDRECAVIRMEGCIRDVKISPADNGFILKERKSEAIVTRSSSLRAPITIICVVICGELVATQIAVVRVWDSSMTRTSLWRHRLRTHVGVNITV